VTKRKTGQDYKISIEFWNRIKPLLTLPKPKKKAGRPRADDWKILSGIFLCPSYRLSMESIAKMLWSAKYRPRSISRVAGRWII
jgi:transposase